MEIAVILDNIRSIHNVGSIFRTSDAAGVKYIYLTGITPQPIDRFGHPEKNFTKVSLGAENSVSWEYVKSIATLINRLKKKGFHIVAVEQSEKALDYRKFKKEVAMKNGIKKIALIVGNEVEGVKKPILDKSDTILEIPMAGKKESLNVAVAFGVVVFQLI